MHKCSLDNSGVPFIDSMLTECNPSLNNKIRLANELGDQNVNYGSQLIVNIAAENVSSYSWYRNGAQTPSYSGAYIRTDLLTSADQGQWKVVLSGVYNDSRVITFMVNILITKDVIIENLYKGILNRDEIDNPGRANWIAKLEADGCRATAIHFLSGDPTDNSDYANIYSPAKEVEAISRNVYLGVLGRIPKNNEDSHLIAALHGITETDPNERRLKILEVLINFVESADAEFNHYCYLAEPKHN